MDDRKVKNIIEGALLAIAKPLSMKQIEDMFDAAGNEKPDREQIKQALNELTEEYSERGVELKQVSSGYRIQVKQEYETWIGRLWEEKPPRYSRALLETLAIIAYRQPITRSEIEEIRGVSVSSSITKTLQERDWVRVVGHRDVPGKPAMFGTTKEFLDYFNLQHLDELPTLAELRDLDALHNPQLDLQGDAAESSLENGVEQSDSGNEPDPGNIIELASIPNENPESLH
jgi:segregation and condensation protein B